MSDETRLIFFPYCIQKLADGRRIVLNRKYKPLGISEAEHIEYESHPSSMTMTVSRKMANELSWDGQGENTFGQIFLYNDGCIPTKSDDAMNAYLRRLSILMHAQLD